MAGLLGERRGRLKASPEGLLDVSVQRIYFPLPKERAVVRRPLPREKTRM